MKKPFQQGEQKNKFDSNPSKGGRGEDMTGPLDVPKKKMIGKDTPVNQGRDGRG